MQSLPSTTPQVREEVVTGRSELMSPHVEPQGGACRHVTVGALSLLLVGKSLQERTDRAWHTRL